MYHQLGLCVVVSLLAPAIAAQNLVTPSHFTKAEGNTYAYGGIGTTQSPSTLLQIYDELQGTPRTIRAVSFRRDGEVDPSAWTQGAWLVNVFCSTSKKTAATPSSVFAENHGTDKTKVSSFSFIQLPASTFVGSVAPFEFRVPFTQPFAFGGNGPLCVEIQVVSRTQNNTYYFDYAYGQSANPYPPMRSFGTGCKVTGQTSPMTLQASASPNWPAGTMTLGYTGYYLPNSALVTIGLGLDDQSIQGLPLPLTLPGTGSAPSGPCIIYHDFVVTFPALSSATGTMSTNFGFPVNPFYNGVDLYAQVVALDIAANPFGVTLSNATQHHLVSPFGVIPVGTVYSDTTLGPTGTVLANQGYVAKIEY